MTDATIQVPAPTNEPVLTYERSNPERRILTASLNELAGAHIELPATIGDEHRMGAGDPIEVVQPHRHAHVLGTTRSCTSGDAGDAIKAALAASPAWRDMSFEDRAAIFLKAADLLAGPWRARLNAATMLGQSKTVIQAEVDSACELVDFWRFNVHFAAQILSEQPISGRGTWNRLDHRPLEGFVYAITPFNFTAIAGNLPTAPALMGNTVIWKPSSSQQFSAHFLMRLLIEAGLPPGVINMVTGTGQAVSQVLLADEHFAGLHFTGSTALFQQLWRTIGENIAHYRSYPRIVGETGGKDFILAHPSADPAALTTALIRGAFEYQGQKCSAASRAYIPTSLWREIRDDFAALVDSLRVGDVTEMTTFMGAVIDRAAFDRNAAVIERAKVNSDVRLLAGGRYDDSEGFFVRPTLLESTDPCNEFFATEYFGPILAIHVYDDSRYEQMFRQIASVTPYALTGSIIAQDRRAITSATEELRFAAGNFYINDKPTGAVVGQQPFGGGRASGTNDKAGAAANLRRWVSPRSIKETFVPPTDYRYSYML